MGKDSSSRRMEIQQAKWEERECAATDTQKAFPKVHKIPPLMLLWLLLNLSFPARALGRDPSADEDDLPSLCHFVCVSFPIASRIQGG